MARKYSSLHTYLSAKRTVHEFVIATVCYAQQPSDRESKADRLADELLKEEFRKKIELLPENVRKKVGTELQRLTIDKIRTKKEKQKALTSLGSLYLSQGEAEKAVDAYKKAIEINDASPTGFFAGMKLVGAYEISGMHAEANEVLGKLLEYASDNEICDLKLSSLHIDSLCRSNKRSQAIDQVIKYSASCKFGVNHIAVLGTDIALSIPHEKICNRLEMFAKVRKAIKACADHRGFLSNEISSYVMCRKKTPDRAKSMKNLVGSYRNKFPDDPDGYHALATCGDYFSSIGMPDEASEIYKTALSIKSLPPEVRSNIEDYFTDIKKLANLSASKEKITLASHDGNSFSRSVMLYATILAIVILSALVLIKRKQGN